MEPGSSDHQASTSPIPTKSGSTESFEDQIPLDGINSPPDDAFPSDIESIPVDEGIIQIPLDNEDDISTPSEYFEEESDSDSDNDTELSDEDHLTDSEYVVEYDDDDDEGELAPKNLGITAENVKLADNSLPSVGRENIENHLRQKITAHKFTDKFPLSNAGVPITTSSSEAPPPNLYSHNAESDINPYAPFADRMNWEIARWAKLRGPGSTAVSELLSIDQVCEYSILVYSINF